MPLNSGVAKTTFRLPKSLLRKTKHFATDRDKSDTEVFKDALRLYLSGKVWIVFNHTGDDQEEYGGVIGVFSTSRKAQGFLKRYIKTGAFGEVDAQAELNKKPPVPLDEGDYHIDYFALDDKD